MKIQLQYHVPLKGIVSCEHCHTPIEHWGANGIDRDRDEAHARLAKEAAQAFGETWDGEGMLKTPRKYFPHMMKQVAEYLAARVEHTLFCPYCGHGVEQPKVCETLDNISPLPKISGNIMGKDALERWVKDTGREAPSEWRAWSDLASEQHKVAATPFSTF